MVHRLLEDCGGDGSIEVYNLELHVTEEEENEQTVEAISSEERKKGCYSGRKRVNDVGPAHDLHRQYTVMPAACRLASTHV